MPNELVALGALLGFVLLVVAICLVTIRYADSIESFIERLKGVPAPSRKSQQPSVTIHFGPRHTLPEHLELKAKQLGITVEQLILRFIADGLRDEPSPSGPDIPVNNLDDWLVKNGALKPKKE